ncbi:hypothetical protein HanPI659440_Chr04g0162881 [Helianthus annuus]|nr:hypothetical protein HanPI659440_Chr04g0162881 [Helianthus annuus]KAJ0931393.1 hypothetical protein HanPSC8_Chr04g0161161 [Helianthus annuus]
MEAFPILRLIYNLLLLIGGFKGSFMSPALFYLHHPSKVKHLFASDGFSRLLCCHDPP